MNYFWCSLVSYKRNYLIRTFDILKITGLHLLYQDRCQFIQTLEIPDQKLHRKKMPFDKNLIS